MSGDNNELRLQLEGAGLTHEQIDAVIPLIPEMVEKAEEPKTEEEIAAIREAIASEPDWRKKASLTASLISKRLDSGDYYS